MRSFHIVKPGDVTGDPDVNPDTTTPDVNPDTTCRPPDDDDWISKVWVVLLSVGVTIVVVALIIVLTVVCLRRKKRRQEPELNVPQAETQPPMVGPAATEEDRTSNSGDGQEGDSDNESNLERKGSAQSNHSNREVSLSPNQWGGNTIVVFHRGNDENAGSRGSPSRVSFTDENQSRAPFAYTRDDADSPRPTPSSVPKNKQRNVFPINTQTENSGSWSRQADDGEHLMSDSAQDYAHTAGTSGEDQSLLAGGDDRRAGGGELATEPPEHMNGTSNLDNVHEPDTIEL